MGDEYVENVKKEKVYVREVSMGERQRYRQQARLRLNMLITSRKRRYTLERPSWAKDKDIDNKQD
jgi:hypothetical protein